MQFSQHYPWYCRRRVPSQAHVWREQLDVAVPQWHRAQHPALRHLSNMHELQSLQILQRCPAFETFLPHLPRSITALVISDTEVAGELQAATRLTGLCHLELDNAELDPIFLLSWPSLQHLQLSSILLTCEAGGHGGAAAPPAAALPAPAGGGHANAEAPAVAPAVPVWNRATAVPSSHTTTHAAAAPAPSRGQS